MKNQNIDQEARRDFLKKCILVATAIPMASFVLSACTKSADALPEGQKELTESDPVAQALGYKQDGAEVDTAKFPKKAAADGASQRCQGCAQFTAVNGGWGKCNIFPQGLVKSGGWCNSFVAKPQG